MLDTALAFDNVTMRFGGPGNAGRLVLEDISFQLAPGDIVSLAGRSGTGKSTLLHLAAGITLPTAGSIRLAGRDLAQLDESRRTTLRRLHLGLVFQFFHLLPHLSVLENILLPGWIAGHKDAALNERAAALLGRVGLAGRVGDPVAQLSGGEMQRVAICRALVLSPALILADEPTGSLDEKTGRQVMDLLLELVRSEGCSLLYVTHSRELAGLADRRWRLHDGHLEPEVPE